ncbi:hypothetical protein SNE40_015949 [Patella caerulea]|uniref:Uncharacterized protein n=1 Tax=Patella caerulea TaxID=87958 RepID=A0AAN8PLK1_PATCE
MKFAVVSALLCVAIYLPQPTTCWGGYGGVVVQPKPVAPVQDYGNPFIDDGGPTFPVNPVGNPSKPTTPKRPKRPSRGGRANQCKTYANRGSCRFYKCFRKIESECVQSQGEFLINNLETFCLNTKPLIKRNRFTASGKKYINRVRRCQNGVLVNFLSSKDCVVIHGRATMALLGLENGVVDRLDCYWQNQKFCEIIGNARDNAALVEAVFGDEDGGFDDNQIAQAEHFQYLARFCPQDAQNVFQETFVNSCPPGTIQGQNNEAPTTPMMMMMGGGGAD